MDDLIDGFLKLMATPDTVTGPMNLGNPGEFTIKELAEQVITLTGSSSELIYKDLPQDDPLQRCPDITLAKDIIDWQPKIALADGLKRTIAHFQHLISA